MTWMATSDDMKLIYYICKNHHVGFIDRQTQKVTSLFYENHCGSYLNIYSNHLLTLVRRCYDISGVV